jgi:Aspartyl/Asparaginyl beta-hydroxylase
MHLDTPFVRLPLTFDATRLAMEINALPESAWRPHPQGYPGNTALPLVSAGGDPANELTRGPMRPTPWLTQMPYLRQVMAALGCSIGRSRLMRIDGNGEASLHVDTNYYWATHVRIHVPVITTPDVEFLCGAARVHMTAGECWIFDTWSLHNVINPAPTRRIHLVCDSVGAPAFWDLVERGQRPQALHPAADPSARHIAFRPDQNPEIGFESCNQPVVMTPFELTHWCNFALTELHKVAAADQVRCDDLAKILLHFQRAWMDAWTRHGILQRGHAGYRQLLQALNNALTGFDDLPRLANGVEVAQLLRQLILRSALNPDIALALQDDPRALGAL